MDRREKLARAICEVLDIPPERVGHAITDKTKERLGTDPYPCWMYWLHVVDRMIQEIDNG